MHLLNLLAGGNIIYFIQCIFLLPHIGKSFCGEKKDEGKKAMDKLLKNSTYKSVKIYIMQEKEERKHMEEVYNQIIDIARRYNAKKVVLFGSRARGTNQPKSDIDLAIYGCEAFGELSDSLNEDLWSLLKLDIINMNDEYVSPALIAEIEKDGKVLYEKI